MIIKRFEDLDFSGYILEETRYKEVQNIVNDILIDLDEFTSIVWSLEELKSKYFPNVYVANSYDCVADLTIITIDSVITLPDIWRNSLPKHCKEEIEWKPIIERLISQLNNEGFVVFEHSSKNVTSSQDIVTNNWLINKHMKSYKNFKICLIKSKL